MFVWCDDLSCHFIVLLSISGISTCILDISPGHQTIHPLREGKWFSRMDLPVRLSEISNNAGSNYGINVWKLCNGTCELSEKSVLHLMIHVLCCTMLHVYMFIVSYNIQQEMVLTREVYLTFRKRRNIVANRFTEASLVTKLAVVAVDPFELWCTSPSFSKVLWRRN